MRFARTIVLAVVLSAVVGGSTGAESEEGPELLAEQGDSNVRLTGERRIEVIGIRGSVSIRTGPPGELRYMVRSRENRQEERPVALWLDGTTLRIVPVAGQEEEPLLLEIVTSVELSAKFDLTDGALKVKGLRRGLEVRGRGMEVDARDMKGGLEFDLEDGRLVLFGSEDEVVVSGKNLEASLQDVRGDLELSLVTGDVKLGSIEGQVELDLQEATLTASGVEGYFRATASGGSFDVGALKEGGFFDLDDTALVLTASSGEFEIETNSTFNFQELKADVRVQGYGGGIRGADTEGGIEIRTNNAEVQLQNINGATRVEGDGLTLRMGSLRGDLNVAAISSDMLVDGVDGLVDIQNEFGDTVVRRATQAVKAVVRDGDVKITELSGPLELVGDGSQVEVSWSAMGQEDSSIETKRGDIQVYFPVPAAGRVEAEARDGTIESTLRGVRVTEDGNFASGVLGQGNRPRIVVKSGGDLFLGPTSSRPN